MNVAFVTGSEKKCGIHYYADAVCDILSKSTKHNFYLIECDSEQEFTSKCNADIAIFNYHPRTLEWFTPEVSSRVKQIQFMIEDHANRFQQLYHLLPNMKEVITVNAVAQDTEHFHPGIRPITYFDDIVYKKPGSKLRVGTSGVATTSKNIDVMVNLINQQFTEPVEFHIHFSVGAFTGVLEDQIHQYTNYLKSIASTNVEIFTVCKRMTDYELIKWLNQNDINIFIYPPFDSDAVSASIDKALAAKKPIGINTSNFFKHIYSPDRNLAIRKIIDIVNDGVGPLQKYYDIWNPQTLLEQYETLVNKYE